MIPWKLFPQIFLFMSLIVIASFLIIENPSGYVLSSTGTVFYVVLYIFDPVTAFTIVALGYAIGNTLPRRWVTWRTCFNGAQMGLSVFLGGLAYRGLHGDPASPEIIAQILPAFAGPIVHQIANNFFISFFVSRERRVRFLRTWANYLLEPLWTNLLSVPTAVLIAILYVRVHHAFALLFLISLPFQRWALQLYLDKRKTYARIIENLVKASELSLPGTRGHAQRVASISVLLARHFGLAERDVEAIEYAALLHDIGMIGMDEMDTSKASALHDEALTEHARLGANVVSELARPDITDMVLHHHAPTHAPALERTEVSLGARIIAVAEDVDSQLFGLYPYSDPVPMETVIARLDQEQGRQFDSRVVEAFLALAKDKDSRIFATQVLGATAGQG
jgi:putative nucleotidyltransferase with HDIG domain